MYTFVKCCYGIGLFGALVVYPLYNLVIDSIATNGYEKMIPPSTSSKTKTTVYALLIVSTVFSAIRVAVNAVLCCYKICRLLQDDDYHIIPCDCSDCCGCNNICGNDFECSKIESDLQKKIRKYEILELVVSLLILVENSFQTGVVYSEFICKPKEYGDVKIDGAFEWTCLVDVAFLLLLTYLPYLITHKCCGCQCECDYPSKCCCCQCECDYPSKCCCCALGFLVYFGIVVSIISIIFLGISIGRVEKKCVLLKTN